MNLDDKGSLNLNRVIVAENVYYDFKNNRIKFI